jgi:predicted pyridoxine 5'-phosphate oxidase superfamily flavin-nucleotide-binding protein
MTSKPYHEGEIAVQRAAGDEAAARQTATMIANVVPAGAASFLSLQRMLVVASRDDAGRPWASILFGDPGFVFPRDHGRVVAVDRSASYSPNDVLPWPHLRIGSPLGLLAIDLSTRRRLRVNGVVGSLTEARLELTVEQAYPNCPKYIQRRRIEEFKPGEDSTRPAMHHGRIPDAALAAAVESADTIFVSSGHPTRGLDGSHRGGPPGFIKAVAPDVFRVPDYEGNGMFNTLGNLAVDARSGVPCWIFGRAGSIR